MVLSSANSINVGRLVPQVVYYFSAYAQLLERQVINVGDEVEFVVPTGNFGDILALQAEERGKSGRISKLRIVGTEKTFVIGKELEIRRALSDTHLYSSAFVVDRCDIDEKGVPQRFDIIGAGWGHGVGLCQIGAAVMGEEGFDYDAILLHYYQGAEIKKVYK